MRLLRHVSIIDIVNFCFWLIMTIFYVLTFRQSEYKTYAFVLLLSLFLFQLLVLRLRAVKKRNFLIKAVLSLYPLIYLIFVFDSIHTVLPYINPHIYDKWLADMDYAILGTNPTVAIEKIVNPYLTELMYILYFFYFPMPLIILVWLYRKKMYVELDKTLMFYMITYYGSYLIYFLVPALGPRFYEPVASMQKASLDGLWLTNFIRDTIDTLEHNKFDAFPSLHAAITLTTILVIARYRKKWLVVFIPLMIGIFVSLIYCRYHYFIDIIAGVTWTLIAYWIVQKTYDKYIKPRFVPFYRE